MAVVISLAMQKGGVGKTSTAIAIASYLALTNKKTLLIDFDPQSNATEVFISGDDDSLSLKEVFLDNIPLKDVIRQTKLPNLHILPANISVAKLERHFVVEPEGMYFLRDLFEDTKIKDQYDYIIIDNSPSLGMNYTNALVASDFVIIPLQCSKFSSKGVRDLQESIDLVRKRANPSLELLGVLINEYDPRANVKKGIEEDIKNHFGDLLFETRVRGNVKIEEAHVEMTPIFLYAPKSAGAKDYAALCEEILAKLKEKAFTKEEVINNVR
jgi:chromosome partitioning protein